jgi:hypothetical protein
MMPTSITSIPRILDRDIFSFRNQAARNTAKIGEEHVPISAMLIAEVVCAAMYKNVLKMVTPKRDVQRKYLLFLIMICFSFKKGLIANGISITVAIDQRKKAKVTGGISLITALATIKLPDQIIQARIAKPIPIYVFF